MKILIIILIFFGINVKSQYKYYNFEYSKDYYNNLQKKVDYNKISSFIINKIDTKIFKEKLLFIPFYLPECGGCDEARETSESRAINEISYLNFWNENTFKKFLKKFSNKQIIITSDFYGNGYEPIQKEITNIFKYLERINKTIGIKKRSGIHPEEIYVFNNQKKEKIEIDEEKIRNSDFLLIDLRPNHNNVNGKEKNLKTNYNFLLIRLLYVVKGNSQKEQFFLYDYDNKEIISVTQEELVKKIY